MSNAQRNASAYASALRPATREGSLGRGGGGGRGREGRTKMNQGYTDSGRTLGTRPAARRPFRRTIDRATFLKAKAAWDDGDFGPAWRPYREAMAENGYIWPPTGTKWDNPDDDEPSQRSIIWRAIEDRPSDAMNLVKRSRSWDQVVAGISAMNRRLREDIDLSDRERELDDDEVRIGHRESVQALAGILKRIDDSRPT